MDQPKVERMLRLMMLLSGGVNYTIDELADKLETSYRSIYRYLDTFKAAGFVVLFFMLLGIQNYRNLVTRLGIAILVLL